MGLTAIAREYAPAEGPSGPVQQKRMATGEPVCENVLCEKGA